MDKGFYDVEETINGAIKVSQEYNKLIASQKLAGKLLLKDNKAALAIKNNPPQLYIIEDLLFANIPTLKTFPVWAVKTGTDYTGIVVYSGIAEEGKIVNAIRVKFSDVNIIHVVEADEFVTPYVQARIENGRWELKRLLQLSDSVEAQNALYEQYPELKGNFSPQVLQDMAEWLKQNINL